MERLPRRGYEMNLEIGLTSWLELMSPWNVTITLPEPIVPGSGWASGSHFRSSAPAPCVNCAGAAYGPRLCYCHTSSSAWWASASGPDPALLGPAISSTRTPPDWSRFWLNRPTTPVN